MIKPTKSRVCSEISDQPEHPDAQADLSLQWAHVILLVLSCCGSFTTHEQTH